MSTGKQRIRIDWRSPFLRLLATAGAVYLVFELLIVMFGAITSAMFCKPPAPGEGATMQCGIMSGLSVVGAGFLALAVLAYAGRRLRMRWWWVPAMIVLGVAAIWLGGLFADSGVWLLAGVPVLATWLAMPEGTPHPARRKMALASLIAVLISGLLVAGGAQAARGEKVERIEQAGVPVYAPTERKDLKLYGPSHGTDYFAYNVRDKQKRHAYAYLTSTVDRCLPGEQPACEDRGGTVFTKRPNGLELARVVPGGQIRLTSRELSEPELLHLLNDLQPVDAGWMVDHLER